MLCKKGVLRNFIEFTRKHLCQSLFFNEVAGLCNFIRKESLAQVLSCEFCEISKNTFYREHLCWLLLSISVRVQWKHNRMNWVHPFILYFEPNSDSSYLLNSTITTQNNRPNLLKVNIKDTRTLLCMFSLDHRSCSFLEFTPMAASE